MKITIEFKDINEYLEFKEKTAQEELVQEQFIDFSKKEKGYILCENINRV